MNAHIIVGAAFAIAAALCARWSWFAAMGQPKFSDAGRYWDWNLWAMCALLPNALGAAYFLDRGLGHL